MARSPAGRRRSSRPTTSGGPTAPSARADRGGRRRRRSARPSRPASALRPILADADLEVVVEDGSSSVRCSGWRSARVVVDDEREAPRRGRRRSLRPGGRSDDVRRPGRGRQRRPGRRHRAPPPPRRRRAPPAQPARARALAAQPAWWPSPARSGAAELDAVPPALPRRNLRERGRGVRGRRRRRRPAASSSPARSASTSTSSRRPPTTGSLHAPGARLVLVVPARDVHPVTTALAGVARRSRPRSPRSRATGERARSTCASGSRDVGSARALEREFGDVEARLADPDVFADQTPYAGAGPAPQGARARSSSRSRELRQRTDDLETARRCSPSCPATTAR